MGLMWARYCARCHHRPENRLKIAPNLPLGYGPSSTGTRRSANIELPMEAQGEVRWDGTFDRPLTPSTARDMADRVVRGRRKRIGPFCDGGVEQKRKKRGGVSHQRVRDNIVNMYVSIRDSENSGSIARDKYFRFQ